MGEGGGLSEAEREALTRLVGGDQPMRVLLASSVLAKVERIVADREAATEARVWEEIAEAQAEAWDAAAEAVAEWMANNPGPSGIPHDPPANPYEAPS